MFIDKDGPDLACHMHFLLKIREIESGRPGLAHVWIYLLAYLVVKRYKLLIESIMEHVRVLQLLSTIIDSDE